MLLNRRHLSSRHGLPSIGFHDAAPSASKSSFWRVIWLVRLIMHICTYREVLVVLQHQHHYNIAVATYPRVYVHPVEKHELVSVTSTCTMSCNVLLQDCTRHKQLNCAFANPHLSLCDFISSRNTLNIFLNEVTPL